ncbi:Coagulation factor XI [Blattella germanica]|nr:Coagulation factor XI [Blattella germanica]
MSSRPDEKRIVGGTQVTPNAYPWMVLITGNNTPACGGSIISDQYVVTAAHCTSLRYRQEELKVVVGQQNYCTPDNKIAIFSIEKMIIHPLFNDTDFSYDIMLLKLSMRILFNDIVRPICLPFWGKFKFAFPFVLTKVNDLDIPETEATILGWGVTAFNSLNRSCELQEATVNVIPRKKCLMNSHYTLQLLPDTLICAGVSDGSKDSCQVSPIFIFNT